MNIQEAKEEIKNTLQAYLKKRDEMVKLFCNTKQDKDTLINVGFFFQMVLSNHLRNVDVYGYNIHIHILPLPD